MKTGRVDFERDIAINSDYITSARRPNELEPLLKQDLHLFYKAFSEAIQAARRPEPGGGRRAGKAPPPSDFERRMNCLDIC
jgi:hypothetical protein